MYQDHIDCNRFYHWLRKDSMVALGKINKKQPLYKYLENSRQAIDVTTFRKEQ